MQTLAQILAGQGGNPYQPATSGGGISPLVQQLLLANQLGGQQVGEQNPMPSMVPGMPQNAQQPVLGQPALPTGIGSMGQAAAMTNGIY